MDFNIILQKAIISLLSNDNKLTNIVEGIYSHVSSNTPYPYIKFDEIRLDSLNLGYKDNYKYQFHLKVFSNDLSNKECLDILHRMKMLIKNYQFNIKSDKSYIILTSSINIKDIRVKQLKESLIWEGELTASTYISCTKL